MKDLLIYVLEVLACSAALLSVYTVLLERRTTFRHCRFYLIGAMLLAALIPALSIPVWAGETLYPTADPTAGVSPSATTAVAGIANVSSLPLLITLLLYTLGVLYSSSLTVAQIVRIRRLRHGARTIRHSDCEIVRTQADIASFSFFRTIYLHDATPESDIAAIVAHELSHIRHRHSLERIVMECIKALLWWNPFVWIAARRLIEVEEYEADRDVLAQGYDPAEYTATIFKALFGYSPDIANGLRDSLTKKRFQIMTKQSGDSHALLRLAGSIPVVLLLLASFSFTSQATEVRTDPPSGQTDSGIEIVSVDTIGGKPIRIRPTLPDRYGKTDTQTTGRQASAAHSRSIDQKVLVFIDGKEVKQDTLKTMNPDLIECISVYKDSSAVVRYGERGRNGVILIETKQ